MAKDSEDLYVDDPAYWHPRYWCVYGHRDCATVPDGQCAGQRVLFDEREQFTPPDKELDDIIDSIRREFSVGEEE